MDHQTVISHAGGDRAQVARLDNEGAAPVEAFLVFELLADPDRSWLGERGDPGDGAVEGDKDIRIGHVRCTSLKKFSPTS